MNLDLFRNEIDIDPTTHTLATYNVAVREGKSLKDAALAIALGQSVGNPSVRNQWETPELFERHAVKIIDVCEETQRVVVAFPMVNLNWRTDGPAQLLCMLMGGQMDIDFITRCRLIHLQLPLSVYKKPYMGMSGTRTFTGRTDTTKPLLGTILKPKTGLSVKQLMEMVHQLVQGGTDFIKEDEILGNPDFCPTTARLDAVAEYCQTASRKFIYCACINGTPSWITGITERVLQLDDHYNNIEGVGTHLNFWSGFGAYPGLTSRFIHFQKSGDRILTHPDNPFGIDWTVIVELITAIGVDSFHAGMWGGYLSSPEAELTKVLSVSNRRNVIPSLSCGMHPGLVASVVDRWGGQIMLSSGGSVHGHPWGTEAGTLAMRQAIDGDTSGKEYKEAIRVWGQA